MLAVMRGLAIATVVAVVRAAAAEPAPSESAASEATEIFNEARALAKDGRFDEACVLFAKSYDLDPGLGTAVNLADCLERQGKLYRAWVLFDLVARNSQNVQSRARLARDRADALISKLATVVVTLHDPGAPGLAVRIGDRRPPRSATSSSRARSRSSSRCPAGRRSAPRCTPSPAAPRRSTSPRSVPSRSRRRRGGCARGSTSPTRSPRSGSPGSASRSASRSRPAGSTPPRSTATAARGSSSRRRAAAARSRAPGIAPISRPDS